MTATNVSNVNNRPDRTCSRCGGDDLVECETTTSIWSGEKPYVIEQIPALRCETCSEVLINGETAETLKQIGHDVLNGGMTGRTIEVPVIAFPAPSY
ncbi:MAG: YgiT-type zinc finger protein [Marivita sp.]|uniref:YgiT-type zinc finger protein n=1 Tax=Marivita sp. TaxID=2003365 RepID=UPI003EF97E42